MTRGIFYTTRAIDGREGKNLCRHLNILKRTHATVHMLTANKTAASKKLAESYGSLGISNHVLGEYKLSGKQIDILNNPNADDPKGSIDWFEVYQQINPVILENYESLYIIGGLDLHRSNLGRFEKRVGKFPRDRDQLKFDSAHVHLINILAMIKAHRKYGIPLHEVAFDPNEMSCDLFHADVAPVKGSGYHLYHGYDIPLYGAHRLDSLQCWLADNTHLLFPEDYSQKSIDFTFGYTVLLNSGREHYPLEIDRIAAQFTDSKVFSKNEYTKVNSHISADKYLDLIKQSKFTYMLPSYNKHCFSVYRFLESIYHDCLPLVHPDCNITDIGTSFNILDTLMTLRSGTIPNDDDRLEMLAMLKSKMLTPTKLFK
jgi:hypothetical protein